MAGSLFNDADGFIKGLPRVTVIESPDIVEDFLSPNAARFPDFDPPQFTVEDEDGAAVEKRHVVFNHDIFVFEGTTGMGHQ